MSDDRSTFETTRARLEDIVVQVRRKDVSLEQSLDMLEEAVRLVNQCNELIDQTSFRAPVAPEGEAVADAVAEAEAPAGPEQGSVAAPAEAPESDEAGCEDEGEDASVESVTIVETFELLDIDADDIEFVEVDTFRVVSDAEIEDDERS
jgi:exodeoxyribonuclease VII small subunit